MSEASPTKQKLDEFRASLPPGDEHTEPTREMLRVSSYACNGAPDKQQALADAVGGIALFLATVHKGEGERILAVVNSAIDAHVVACRKNMTTTVTRTEQSSGGVILPGRSQSIVSTVVAVVAAFRPVAWPLAFICFSPNAVEIFRLVIEVFSRQ